MNRYDDYTDSFISDDIDQKSYMLGYLNGCKDMLKKINELNSLQIHTPYKQSNMRGEEE